MHGTVVRRPEGRAPDAGWARRALVALVSLVVPLAASAEPHRWAIETENSAAYFTVKHLMITPVKGTFYDVHGEVWIDDEHIEQSRVHAVISTRGLCSGSPDRNARVQSKDFLWTSRYPSIEFKSTKVEHGTDDRLVVTGNLTLRGVTRTVILEVDGPTSAVRGDRGVPTRSLVARTRIDRKDFGIVWNEPLEGGGMMLSDEVSLEIVLELVEPPPKERERT